MTDNGIVWEDPPESRQGRAPTSWAERLAPIMERPGEWARVQDFSYSSAWQVVSHLRKGLKPVPPGRWEFAARKNQDDPKRAYIYARYLGPEDGA